MYIKTVKSKILSVIMLVFMIAMISLLFFISLNGIVKAATDVGVGEIEIYSNINSLNERIGANKKKINNLKAKIDDYQQDIRNAQNLKVSLQNQMSIIENQVLKSELDIQAVETQIEQNALEIQVNELQIEEKESKIISGKDQMISIIQTINKSDQKNYLEILLLNNSFSEFFNEIKQLEEVRDSLSNIVYQLKNYKKQLELKRGELNIKKDELSSAQKTLNNYKDKLEEKKIAKNEIYRQSVASEKMFRNLLYQARREQRAIDAEVNRLEKQIRNEEFKLRIKQLGGTGLAWPVSPVRGISAYFHDPDYPYRYIFEHPAIDIRAYQGTALKAAASGYVARAKNAGYGYNYIMLIHDNDLSTVYGHVSRFAVKEGQYVSQGQIIGYSGGAPGTPGAGRFSSGPHLHFEVRKNGTPVNPLDYLP